MASPDIASDPPRPWGYIATGLWALVAAVAALVFSYAALALIVPGAPTNSAELLGDMRAFSAMAIASVAAEIAVVIAVARLRGWRATDYLGLTWPTRREAAIAFAVMIAFAMAYDALT